MLPPGLAPPGRTALDLRKAAATGPDCSATATAARPVKQVCTIRAKHIREAIHGIAQTLLGKPAIPAVKAETTRLEVVTGDEWWVDVIPPLMELVRLRLRGLARVTNVHSRAPVYTESPFTDNAPTGPMEIFTPADALSIVSILGGVRNTALPLAG